VYDEESDDLKSFLKQVYKKFEIKYSKFFKMDNLCKLAFLAAELLLSDGDENLDDNTALVFSNRASSLDTDRKFQSTLTEGENSFPSPAVFVYTLANISLGEISIRHALKSENAFFVFNEYQAGFHRDYERSLLRNNKSDQVLGAWVEVDGEQYEAFMYKVSKKGTIEHTEENLYTN